MEGIKPIQLWPEGIPELVQDAPEPYLYPYIVSLSNNDGAEFTHVHQVANAQSNRNSQADSVNHLHAAIIVCPGGGYSHLASHEGEPIAHWLNELGISAFVLQYRVHPYKHPQPLLDAQRAIRIVRARAAEWNIDPHKIGILGFSAGGHLAASTGVHAALLSNGATDVSSRTDQFNSDVADSTSAEATLTDVTPTLADTTGAGATSVESDTSSGESSLVESALSDALHASVDATGDSGDRYSKVSARPDLMIVCYPVISLVDHFHQGSRDRLLGEGASEEQAALMSLEQHVGPNTPPAFIWHTTDDPAVPVENSLMLASALSRHNVPFDLHTFESGQKKHGHGLATKHPEANEWTRLCAKWLKKHDFLPPESIT